MIKPYKTLSFLALGAAFGAISACSSDPATIGRDLWPDGGGTFSTAEAARTSAAVRPLPDAKGVISYSDYQVAVARQGDTVSTVAVRVGISPAELGSYNAVTAEAPLNSGEVLALPRRVSASQAGATEPATAGAVGVPVQSGTIKVTALASDAIGQAQAPGRGTAAAASGIQAGESVPIRHRVQRGETTYTIARLYNIPAQTIADWNGLGPDLGVREGQYLLVPAPLKKTVMVEIVTAPGQGSPTPPPPSSTKPLPAEKITPAAKPAPETPPSPNLEKGRSAASAARYAMPADGRIIRGFNAKKSTGIDIGAKAGSPVVAAANGTVAAITKDTAQMLILVVRHADNILTIYANIDDIKVAKGDKVKRGQSIAVVRAETPAFLHFEVRNGADAVDPMPYLE
jgi:murein DD-endopeptidase MepM/ murein hydrolase activator NlpD